MLCRRGRSLAVSWCASIQESSSLWRRLRGGRRSTGGTPPSAATCTTSHTGTGNSGEPVLSVRERVNGFSDLCVYFNRCMMISDPEQDLKNLTITHKLFFKTTHTHTSSKSESHTHTVWMRQLTMGGRGDSSTTVARRPTSPRDWWRWTNSPTSVWWQPGTSLSGNN